MQHADTRTKLDARLADIDGLLDAWLEPASIQASVREAAERCDYTTGDIEKQLRLTAARCRAYHFRELITTELGSAQALGAVPKRMLLLASSGVPGLAVEAMLTAAALGINVVVRVGRDEVVLQTVTELMPLASPLLNELIEVISADTEPDWLSFDGAIVYGSDDTIAHVRTRLAPAAVVAAYGSREAIAVVDPAPLEEGSVAERLADDVLTFHQRGCMSPRTIFVLGDTDAAARVAATLQSALEAGWDEHIAVAASSVDPHTSRAAQDAAQLATLDTAGAAAVGIADVWVAVEPVTGGDLALVARISLLGSKLQTAVIVSSDERRADLAGLCLDAGCTRIALPGGAHEPHSLWPHDGIGRMAPMLGFRAPL